MNASADDAPVLAELVVRHTRRHMPTRRVALGERYLPTSGPAHGLTLLRAVTAEFADALDDDTREELPRVLAEARSGLEVPRIALRHRLQTDVHGLDRSRHRLIVEHGITVLELDVHGRPAPQLAGAVMAAASMPGAARGSALDAIETTLRRGWVRPDDVVVRHLLRGLPGARPTPPGVTLTAEAGASSWAGVPTETRWAMEVLGMKPADDTGRGEVQRRFRRLLRDAHPDHGGAGAGAAERIAELTEARHVLLRLEPEAAFAAD